MEDIKGIWDLGEAPTEDSADEVKAEYASRVDKLTWYLNVYLPNTVGLAFWGPNLRPFHLMTDKVDIDGDVSGKKKVLVAVTSEAFAHVLWANSRDKWLADFKLKKTNKKAKIPKYDKDKPETHKHQNKWSSSRTGQVQGGGWHKDAITFFNETIKELQLFRKEQEKHDYPAFKFGKQLILAAMGLEMTGDGSNSSKKRKNAPDVTPEKDDGVDIIFLDEWIGVFVMVNRVVWIVFVARRTIFQCSLGKLSLF